MRVQHRWAVGVAVLVCAILPLCAQAPKSEYKSPYSVKFTVPHEELLADLAKTPRGDPRNESSLPFAEWYTPGTREKYGSWGPPAAHYPPPAGLARKSLTWKRERVIAVALRFQGYGYQHHHVPDWQPPAGWPWKETAAGSNGKGVDCSNFTAFVYNMGFGIKPTSAVKDQAEQTEMLGPGEGRTKAQRIELPKSYDDMVKTMRTGDLLFIKGSEKEHVTHVVLWVGDIGVGSKSPLIIDSHGQRVKDEKDVHIPAGVHLRPFRHKSWYFHSASHALRVFRDE
jgi:cell wall-associated NlpC family hydrolase